MTKIWTKEEACKLLFDVDGGFKAGTCREDDRWYQKHNCVDLRNFILEQTSFLDDEVISYHERMLYFKWDVHEKQLCPFCNKLKPIDKGNMKFYSTCSDLECRKKLQANLSKQMHANFTDEQKLKKNLAIGKANSGTLESKYDAEKVLLIKKHISESQIGRKQSQELVEKRMNSRKNNGLPWHTPESKQKISISNQRTHLSDDFREKYKSVYELASQKQSQTMKDKIARGEFTPPITNSWTHFDAFIILEDGTRKKFRSSWEAIYWYVNQHLEYETHRVEYEFNDKVHNYIVDFYDRQNKCLIEIKPKSRLKIELENVKLSAAENWAKCNDHTFIIIDDDWFIQNKELIIKSLQTQTHLQRFMNQFL